MNQNATAFFHKSFLLNIWLDESDYSLIYGCLLNLLLKIWCRNGFTVWQSLQSYLRSKSAGVQATESLLSSLGLFTVFKLISVCSDLNSLNPSTDLSFTQSLWDSSEVANYDCIQHHLDSFRSLPLSLLRGKS